MNPVMQIKQSISNRKLQYELTLSRENFNHLCAGFPDFDRLIGFASNGIAFCIFENPLGEMPSSFKPLPNRNGYYSNIGLPVPTIPQKATRQEFEALAQQVYDNLEREINKMGKIPIEEETELGKINLGYVIIRIENKS